MTTYEATHGDELTRKLRRLGWMPTDNPVWEQCGCKPHRLCAGHATIRAAEHYNPGLAR